MPDNQPSRPDELRDDIRGHHRVHMLALWLFVGVPFLVGTAVWIAYEFLNGYLHSVR